MFGILRVIKIDSKGISLGEPKVVRLGDYDEIHTSGEENLFGVPDKISETGDIGPEVQELLASGSTHQAKEV